MNRSSSLTNIFKSSLNSSKNSHLNCYQNKDMLEEIIGNTPKIFRENFKKKYLTVYNSPDKATMRSMEAEVLASHMSIFSDALKFSSMEERIQSKIREAQEQKQK